MKKNLIAAVVAGALSSSALAADGKIEFVGAITDDACTVTNNMNNPLLVTLGTVASSAFTTGNRSAAPTEFKINLTNCPDSVTSAQVKFDGKADDNDNTILQLTQETGVATNVGIQLMDKSNAVVPLYTASTAYELTAGTNDLKFVARYLATSLPVKAGPANSTSNFTIVYN
ncbi:fimbrial protein [Lelliottia sp. SL45]|uniref:fimbrial protein n=1 Tax=Lelliottia sp. SL45 TaxID=2994665 RepID=UPI00227372E2|nr:fimbrial protein [Lelliottia sp. SL45]MCY1700944.1 fimbrial protein [Lelliottia sp. SL45]